MALYHTKMKHI